MLKHIVQYNKYSFFNKYSFLFIILYNSCYSLENSQENWFVPSFSEFKQNLKTCSIENYFFIKRVSFYVITRLLAIYFVIGLSYKLIFSLTRNKSSLFSHILVILCSPLVANICISGLPWFKNYIHYLWHFNALYIVIHIIMRIKSLIELLQKSQVNPGASGASSSVHTMAPEVSSSVHTVAPVAQELTPTCMAMVHNAHIDDTSNTVHFATVSRAVRINMPGTTQPAFISVQGGVAISEGMLNLMTNPTEVMNLFTGLASVVEDLDNTNSLADISY